MIVDRCSVVMLVSALLAAPTLAGPAFAAPGDGSTGDAIEAADAKPAQHATPAADEPAALVVPISPDGWTAERVAARAVEASTRVAVSEVDRIRAETNAEWRVAEFAPRLDLRATYTRLSEIDQPPFQFGELTIDSPFPQILDQYALQASLTVPVTDAFLAILPAWRAAKGTAEVARWQTETERASAALRAREAFYGFARVEAAPDRRESPAKIVDRRSIFRGGEPPGSVRACRFRCGRSGLGRA